ncbi:MAG: RNA polymerase sigma factor (sigma-70 family) [Limisphaerales bacterium]|jgi:RNA polymerase sigma factor (sigma-70 family)
MVEAKAKDVTKLSDQEIINLMMESGETDLFGKLYDRYSNKVYRKCLSIMKESNTAQDLVHDIMLKVFVSLPKFQGKSKFGSWVYAITYNKCIDHLRNKQRYKEVELEPDREPSDEDDDEHSYHDVVSIKVSRLIELLWELSEVDRVILLMKYQDELSVQEIEELLQIKSSAVKMRLKRARERLRELYASKYRDEV